ncbi:MAG: CRISPR-associated endonuclease Cas2 [Victivallaceae bacterium]|nr:CRISPR-associated endonuclease Cas2 [Victivallaceae bacterium]
MTDSVFNGYRIMWIFVFFDLPTNTKAERSLAAGFRKTLLVDGFTMMQFSVYVRACPTKENTNIHITRIKSMVPPDGKISILSVTDKQFGQILNIWSDPKEPPPEKLIQLTLF